MPTFLPPNVYGILSSLGQVGDDQQEDCLTLNVWSKPQSGEASKPVLVWIYGGGFETGGTNTSAYSGQFFADEEDVVFVSFNYRLGIFGFPGGPTLTQNVGLLDQRLAIEWVRDNIAAFGGDPTRITIFGQSAGGASVDYYSYAWKDDPIIAGTIEESGSVISFGNRLPSSASTQWYNVAKKIGCGDNSTSADQVINCMRTNSNATMHNILEAAAPGSGLASVLGNFGPTIDNKTVFSNYTDLAAAGQFTHVPALIGNNDFEAGLFILIAAGTGLNLPLQQWEDFTEGEFGCPASTAAEFRHIAGVPVWRYRYFPVFPNVKLPTDYDRAWHGAELLPLFGASEEITGEDSTYQERAVGSYLRGAWSSFARCPSTGLTNYGWPMYSNTTESVLQLGRNTTTMPYQLLSLNSSSAFDGMCGSFPYNGALNA